MRVWFVKKRTGRNVTRRHTRVHHPLLKKYKRKRVGGRLIVITYRPPHISGILDAISRCTIKLLQLKKSSFYSCLISAITKPCSYYGHFPSGVFYTVASTTTYFFKQSIMINITVLFLAQRREANIIFYTFRLFIIGNSLYY